jgi:hypothetical protein
MSLTTLKNLRLVIPGVFILIAIFLIIPNKIDELKNNFNEFIKFDFKDILYTTTFILFGVLYHISKLRLRFWNPFLSTVQNNIKDSLLKPFLNTFDENKIASLREGRKLINVFYHFVDNTPSLTEKSNLVRFNGLLWTSFVDLTVISLITTIVIDVKMFFHYSSYNLYLLFGFIVIALFSFWLVRRLLKTHIKLGNEQLEIITELHLNELRDKLINL